MQALIILFTEPPVSSDSLMLSDTIIIPMDGTVFLDSNGKEMCWLG